MRLTNEIRERIIDSVYASKFSDKKVKAVELRDNLYIQLVRWAEGKRKAEIGDRDYRALKKHKSIVRVAKYINICNGSDVKQISSNQEDVFIPCDKYYYAVESDRQSDTLIKKLHSANANINELDIKWDEVRRKTRSIVYAVNTDKQLIEAWPEVVDYFTFPEHGKTTLPAINSKELNSLIEKNSQ